MINFLQSYTNKLQYKLSKKKVNTVPAKISDFPSPIRLKKLMQNLDVFFVCFDEPNRKRNWKNIKKHFHHAKKIEGVRGFDRALKACAESSQTEHFFLIDGDNSIVETKLNQEILLADKKEDWVLSWSAQNSINGLAYGNGGLKLWPKKEALKIKTHENAASEVDPTDYCFISQYYQINNFLTVTNVNGSAFQAFRAGFREGVKMSLVWGKQEKLTKDNFEKLLGPENRERLWVWCNVGADVTNGLWSVYGARMGLKYNAVEMFDYKVISSYEWFEHLWLNKVIGRYRIEKSQAFSYSGAPEELYQEIKKLGAVLTQELPINMTFHNSYGSEQFKENYKNPIREGLLLYNEAAQ